MVHPVLSPVLPVGHGDDSQAAGVAARLVQKALFCFRGHFPGFASRDKHFELPQEMSVYLA